MKFLIGSLLVVLLVAASQAAQPDYYWRDYRGKIPADALVGNVDVDGRKMYIGNVYIQGDGGLYVGGIYPGNRKITVTGAPGHKAYVRTEFIKILCTRSPELFKWKETTPEGLSEIPAHLVEGGYENARPGVLYVGKTTYQGKVKIAKIVGHTEAHDQRLMYFPVGFKQLSTRSFSVLTYEGVEENFATNLAAAQNPPQLDLQPVDDSQ